jgi:hypothetical protein
MAMARHLRKYRTQGISGGDFPAMFDDTWGWMGDGALPGWCWQSLCPDLSPPNPPNISKDMRFCSWQGWWHSILELTSIHLFCSENWPLYSCFSLNC